MERPRDFELEALGSGAAGCVVASCAIATTATASKVAHATAIRQFLTFNMTFPFRY